MLRANKTGDICTMYLDHEDFGIGVSIIIKNFEFSDEDKVVVKIYNRTYDREVLIEKTYDKDSIQDNTFYFMLDENESASLKPDTYSWEIEIFRGDTFLLTVTQNQDFVVLGGV